MQQQHWFLWIWSQLDHRSLSAFLGTIILGAVTQITANQVTLFFTVLVGTTAAIYNIVKTKIAISKEKDRKKSESKEEEDDD